ncbi:hypothetical protein EBR43_06695 [bacterium]|nr:hypothetical protein [bacterium]
MTTFRALCAELLNALEIQLDELRFDNRLCKCARAALSAPEQRPTDEQILAIQDQAVASFSPVHPDAQNLSAIEYARALEIRKARAVLQHLGCPAITPIPASERLPGPEDCDDQGRCWVGTPAISDEEDYGPITYNLSWELCQCTPDEAYWLPHWALPVPQDVSND